MSGCYCSSAALQSIVNSIVVGKKLSTYKLTVPSSGCLIWLIRVRYDPGYSSYAFVISLTGLSSEQEKRLHQWKALLCKPVYKAEIQQ